MKWMSRAGGQEFKLLQLFQKLVIIGLPAHIVLRNERRISSAFRRASLCIPAQVLIVGHYKVLCEVNAAFECISRVFVFFHTAMVLMTG